MENLMMYLNRLIRVMAKIVVQDSNVLSKAFNGCYGVLHTSSFTNPYDIFGFTVSTYDVGLKNVIK